MQWPLDISKYKIIDGEYLSSSYFIETVEEYEGVWTSEDENIVVNVEGKDIRIDYYLGIGGFTTYERGTWETPAYQSTELEPIELMIKRVSWAEDGDEIEITSQEKEHIKKVILALI